uniref:Uncharacterized protein n=1 Tax=Avena sativa TaxID=4498 RepID=A0ACD5X013_AVESA
MKPVLNPLEFSTNSRKSHPQSLLVSILLERIQPAGPPESPHASPPPEHAARRISSQTPLDLSLQFTLAPSLHGRCGAPSAQEGGARKKDRQKQKQNPFTVAYNRPAPARPGLVVLRDPTGRDLDARHVLGGELGQGEFGVTYLCTEAATGARMACKSISKRKLRTPVDVEDVRREVEIMRHMPPHPNIVSLSAAYEDDDAVHLVMELCEGSELFDRIVARGHYTERPAVAVTRTIVEVVQMCHRNGVIHQDLKPENFLYANKKESSPLKAIDFGLSVFFRPGMLCRQLVLKNLSLQ